MKSPELIQVLMCTYQGEQFISEQLDSILSQSYPFFEVHVYDDASTDQTIKIVKEYSKKHCNLFLHENDRNIGFLRNFEQAITNSSANYLALSDQDDIWLKDKLLEEMSAITLLEKNHLDCPLLVHSDLSYIDESGEKLNQTYFLKKGIDLPENRSLSHILGHCGVMGNSILMNRSLANKALPFPEGLKYHDYWLAVINEIYGVRKTLKTALVEYRIHLNNTSDNNRDTLINKKKRKLFDRDFPLPFMDDRRDKVIKFLIENYTLPDTEKAFLKEFYRYLIFKGNRLRNYMFLLKNNFLKKGNLFRVTVLYRFLLTAKYKNLISR